MRATRTSRLAPDIAAREPVQTLRHVLVAGGTAGEWAEMHSSRWSELADELAHVVASAGGSWLTIRPYGERTPTNAPSPPPTVPSQSEHAGGCTVVIDANPDGQARLLAAIERLRLDQPTAPITEASLAAALLAPAGDDPDLVLVLGPADRLPPSLVWELAYSELVFIDCAWPDLGDKHVHDAIVEYGRRERRFGGVNG